jgi:alkyl hydroperoxide reductase subunit F
MLTADLLNALKGYTANMAKQVNLVLQQGEHSKRDELKKFLQDFASVSEQITFEERDAGSRLMSPIAFLLEVDGQDSGVSFSGIPAGHEFNSLVLAVLHASGTEMKLDDQVKALVAGINKPLTFEVFVSLSCHNCPDVVQTLNQFALLNPLINSEMIDGGLYPQVIEERGIQGVPAVYLNGKEFANGKIDTSIIIDKLREQQPDAFGEAKVAEALPVQDVTVIGGGPAGTSAAIYAARKGLAVTIIADRFGGQVKDTMGIENLISVPSTTGPELANNLMQHLDEYSITKREHFRVERIEKGAIKKIHLSSGEVIESKTIIVATGAKWRELGVPGEKENIGKGVAYCPHCDGPFFKGKDVAVVGGGNSGIEAALDLAGIVRSVTVFEFLPELKADQVLVDQAQAKDNIKIIKNAATQEVIADEKVTALKYQDRQTEEVHEQALDGVFVQIGLVPNSAFLEGLVDRTPYGEVIINERCETSEPGIFAAGDVSTVPYKQIVIAMGEGSKASLAAFDYLIRNS